MRIKLFFAAALALVIPALTGAGCTVTPDFNSRLEEIAAPYIFSIAGWEAKTLPREAFQIPARPDSPENEARLVFDYFINVSRIESLKVSLQNGNPGPDDRSALEAELTALEASRNAVQNRVEQILERQIKATLAEQGIFNLADLYPSPKITFPPLNFKLETPPHLLVVSPRDRIESLREIILVQDITTDEMTAIEDEADELGVSSLVLELGGLGATYPSFVTNEASLRFTLNAAAEEWLHQYLAFRPLGFLYVLDLLGISPDYEIATINETVAGIVSKEIGSLVYEKYYTPYNTATPNTNSNSGFDFNREMRDIRRQVDGYLARGEIEAAEEFMEQKRQYLAENGYYIRKLNQAYFAFHGAYGDSPTSVSPIGEELKALRAQCVTLKEFLDKASRITGREDIATLLAQPAK